MGSPPFIDVPSESTQINPSTGYEGEEEEVSEENEEGGDSEEYKEIQVGYAFGIL